MDTTLKRKWSESMFLFKKKKQFISNQGFPFKKIFRGHCDPQVVDFGGHFQFERVTY